MAKAKNGTLNWYRVLARDELPEGRVKAATAGHKTLAMTHFKGQFCALDNRCPHQGGPLGEGAIENGWLRCPWHGWDFDPITGKPPGGYDDGVPTFPVEIRSVLVILRPWEPGQWPRSGRSSLSPATVALASIWAS